VELAGVSSDKVSSLAWNKPATNHQPRKGVEQGALFLRALTGIRREPATLAAILDLLCSVTSITEQFFHVGRAAISELAKDRLNR
jgi:hypothetical protein